MQIAKFDQQLKLYEYFCERHFSILFFEIKTVFVNAYIVKIKNNECLLAYSLIYSLNYFAISNKRLSV